MDDSEEKSRPLRSQPFAGLESPFLEQELFARQGEEEWEQHLGALEGENEFRLAFKGYAREGVEQRSHLKGPDRERIEYEIIGTNDMDAVANSLAVPYRWICRLDIDYDIIPFGTSRRLTGTGRGTGTLISPCHVLTAAHNLTQYDPVRRNTLRATRIRVTPAHDGSSSPPVTTVEADLSQSPVHRLWDIIRRHDATGAANNAGEVETNRYDYALLKLNSAIGDSQVRALGGPLGFWGNQGSGGAARFQRVEPVVLRGSTVFVAGYGHDDCVRDARTARSNSNIRLGSQLTATGQITLVMEGKGTRYVGRSMAHDVDTCDGQSGAPVCLELNGIYCLVGVHTGGVGLTGGGRTNHAVRVTMEVSNQVRDWMTRAPCSGPARELEDDGSRAGERLAFQEEGLAPDGFNPGGGEQELEDGPAGEEPVEWAMEWAGDEGESTPTTPFNQPWGPASAEEPQGEVALENDIPPMTQAISDAVDQKDWPRALELAMQVGWHDENRMTNLLFYSRHTELDRRKLDPKKNKEDRKLAQEWSQILVKEVRPAIQKTVEDRNLEVSGRFVAERDPELSGENGKKFREVVAWAAKEVDMDPGFLAAVLLAEVGRASPYLSHDEVRSFFTGTDDFFAQRAQLRDNVPAFAQVRFDERRKTTNINEHGRTVTTIPYKTGRDAALATAVYLKYGEIKLRRAAQKNGGDFDALPVATRFVLVRIGMAAGHGGISPDGDLIRFKKKGGRLVRAMPGETGGILLGVARSLDRVLKGEDILVRNWEPRKDPTNDSHITHRNATILTSQAMHLGDWFFRAQPLGVQPELEEAFVKEEAHHEEAPADLAEVQKEIYYEDEAPYLEGETDDEKPRPRMKFEIQTRNRIWRNDGKTATLLERKYGPEDFLIDRKGVRLESETNGVLEFETEWFRSWPKLKEAMEKAVKMTDDMNRAAAAKYEKSRRAFPFSVDHLRKGSKKEIAQGFWDKRPGKEGEKERILRAGEELEVEIVDPFDLSWKAGIQSSESFLLEYYESFLRQHEWPFFRDGTIIHAKAILDAANTGGIHATELGKLRSLLQIIVNYIMRGQGGQESADAGAFADVEGMPAKQAFALMSRTNFASMHKVLLTDKEKRLFEKIVKNDSVLQEMGLDRKSPVFIQGYGTKHHEPGPTVYQWLAGIVRGVDLLSVQSVKSLSAAMGRYNVETRNGKKDRWMVKFETRNTILGAVEIEAKDWVKYASKLFDTASKRESDALGLLHKQGIVDEAKLVNFVFHARHPELGGRRIRKGERALADEWLRIRDAMVRPLLQGVQPELEAFEESGFAGEEFEEHPESHYGALASELAGEAGYPDYEAEDDYPAETEDRGEEEFFPEELFPPEAELDEEEFLLEDRHDPELESETRGPKPEIRDLQRSLNAWRREKGQPPVRDDGLPGPETRTAVLEFQKASGIKREDGIAGPATRQRLRLLLDILRNIPVTPLFAEDRRNILELVGGAGFRSLEEPEQTGVLSRIRGYQRPGTVDNIRLLTNLVAEPGFERLPASSQKIMLRTLAARPGDAGLAGNLIQLVSSTGFRNLEESTQNWVLKRIERNSGNRTRVDNLENLITATNNFDQLSRQSRSVMLSALANRPGDSRLVDNFRRAADRADFRALDQQTQTDVLTRIVNYPRAFVHVDNLMSLVTTSGFGDLAPAVITQVLDGLPSRFGTTGLTSVIIGNLMSVLTAKGFERLRPEIRDLILDSQAQRPDNTQLASTLRTLIENPKFRHDQREARKAVLQVVDSIP